CRCRWPNEAPAWSASTTRRRCFARPRVRAARSRPTDCAFCATICASPSPSRASTRPSMSSAHSATAPRRMTSPSCARSPRPGGLVLVETNHRDVAVSMLAHGNRLAQRLDDGTLLIEEPRFDAVAGRIETSWYWSGPRGSGQKAGSLRVYSITELVRLMEAAGLRLRSAHSGLSAQPYVAQPPLMGGRVGLLAERA